VFKYVMPPRHCMFYFFLLFCLPKLFDHYKKRRRGGYLTF